MQIKQENYYYYQIIKVYIIQSKLNFVYKMIFVDNYFLHYDYLYWIDLNVMLILVLILVLMMILILLYMFLIVLFQLIEIEMILFNFLEKKEPFDLPNDVNLFFFDIFNTADESDCDNFASVCVSICKFLFFGLFLSLGDVGFTIFSINEDCSSPNKIDCKLASPEGLRIPRAVVTASSAFENKLK